MDNQYENNVPVDPENELPVELPAVEKKPSFLSRIKKPIVLIPVAGAAAVLLTVGAVSANTDKAVTYDALSDLGEMFTKNDMVTVLSKSYDKRGRISVTVDEGDLLPTDVRVDMWMNKSDSKFVLKASAVGEDATIYLSDSDFIGETSILSDAYGLNFQSLLDDMKDSEWASEYVSSINEFEETLETFTDQMSEMKKTGKEAEKLLEKYYKLLFETIFDNAKVNSTLESGNRVITIVVDQDCVAKSINEVWQKAAKDKKLTGFLDDHLNVEMLGIDDEYDSWKEILSDSDIREEVCSMIERADFQVKVEITASSIAHNLKKLKVSIGDSDETYVTVTIDRTEKNTTKLKVSVEGETVLSAKLIEDGDNLSGSLNVMDEEVFAFKWTYEKKNKSFKLAIDLPTKDIEVVLKGDYEATGKRFYIKAEDLTVTEGDETLVEMELNVAVEIVAGEKTPDFPKSYKNVFDLDEEDLEDIMKEFEEWAEEFQNGKYFKKLDEFFNRI